MLKLDQKFVIFSTIIDTKCGHFFTQLLDVFFLPFFPDEMKKSENNWSLQLEEGVVAGAADALLGGLDDLPDGPQTVCAAIALITAEGRESPSTNHRVLAWWSILCAAYHQVL